MGKKTISYTFQQRTILLGKRPMTMFSAKLVSLLKKCRKHELISCGFIVIR